MFSIKISEEIELRLMIDKDAEEFYSMIQKNKHHLKMFMPRIMETNSVDKAKNVIRLFLNQLIDNNGFRAAVFYNSEMVGIAGLKYIDWANNKTEIMYWIDEDYLGKGIITACVKKIKDIALNDYKLNKVIIKTSVDNIASKRVAEKCGFILESVNRQDELLASGYTDINTYSILKKLKGE